MPDLPRVLRGLQRAQRFFDRHFAIDPMQLIQIDPLELQPLQTFIDALRRLRHCSPPAAPTPPLATAVCISLRRVIAEPLPSLFHPSTLNPHPGPSSLQEISVSSCKETRSGPPSLNCIDGSLFVATPP